MGVSYFFLKNKRDGDVADVANESREDRAPLIAFAPRKPPPNPDNQLWELVLSGTPPYFFIANKQTGRVIDVRQEAGLPLIVFPEKSSGTDNQLWMLEPSDATEEHFFIVSKRKEAEVITVNGPKKQKPEDPPPPLAASLRKPRDNDDQLWSFVRYG